MRSGKRFTQIAYRNGILQNFIRKCLYFGEAIRAIEARLDHCLRTGNRFLIRRTLDVKMQLIWLVDRFQHRQRRDVLHC